MRTVICDYCGQPAKLVDSSIVYNGLHFGKIWHCAKCNAYVSTHKDSDEPMGTLANAELRQWRRKAHHAFDPLWRDKEKRTRRWAYEWLAQEMGLTKEQTHIAKFDVEQCKQVVNICKEAKRHE